MSWPQTFSKELIEMLAAVYGALATGSVIRFIALRKSDETLRKKRLDSLRTWWILAGIVGAALLLGRAGICLLMAIASALAFREYARIVGTNPMDGKANVAVYLVIALNYLILYSGNIEAYSTLIPIFALLPAVLQLLQGRTEGYMRSTAGLYWGSIILIYAFSHSVLLFILPETANGAAGGVGWFLYLVLLTETNDIAQALVGRRFGSHNRHRIVPRVSPNKTWEGFLGGMITTIILAILLAPWMTTLLDISIQFGPLAAPGWLTPVFAGILVALAGFFGDINMSAIKRDVGVKDSSSMLPGMGGLIDRIDSLTFTAPAFVSFVRAISG
ncbi:MAG TPA: phosphatidate cytidylyltransferase [Peptococcaceae bacterium]|nr:phosphatidate cytidylyltransferase [Peptococcaceae bacterium]